MRGGFLEIEVEGQRVKLWAELRGQVLWLHHEGRTFTYELEGQKGQRTRGARGGTSGSSSAVDGDSGRVTAPMPGKIIKLLVKQGEPVEVRQPLVVMEAMKMEYTLESAQKGEVLEVHCAEGDQVSLGQALVVVGAKK